MSAVGKSVLMLTWTSSPPGSLPARASHFRGPPQFFRTVASREMPTLEAVRSRHEVQMFRAYQLARDSICAEVSAGDR
jgi:hypothetical protein